MLLEVKVPRIGVNEDFVKLVEWYINDKDYVKEESPLCLIETTKASFEVEAERNGFIKTLVQTGERVPIQETICVLADTLEELESFVIEGEKKKPAEPEVAATRKAVNLANKLGLDLKEIKKSGVIKEKDVEEFYQKKQAKPAMEVAAAIGMESRAFEFEDIKDAKVNPDFVRLIETDPSFRSLSSELKIYLYRQSGAKVGKNVIFEPGSAIIADFLVIGDKTVIGENTFIKGEIVKIGEMVEFGKNVNAVTKRIAIGDVVFFGNNILIGGGGAWGKNSGIEIGARSLISSECIINTGEFVKIGEEVGLSPRVQIFTHSHWQNILKGYKPAFGPVTIGDGSYITGNCLITPGVKLGKGCTVLANSLVIEDVEDFTMVVGVPAKPTSKIDIELSLEQKDRIMRRLMKELWDEVSYRGFDSQNVQYFLEYNPSRDGIVPVVLCFSKVGDRKQLPKTVIFDLTNYEIIGKETPLSDEVRNFLRRRGVRFKPIFWRYEADRGLYNQ